MKRPKNKEALMIRKKGVDDGEEILRPKFGGCENVRSGSKQQVLSFFCRHRTSYTSCVKNWVMFSLQSNVALQYFIYVFTLHMKDCEWIS